MRLIIVTASKEAAPGLGKQIIEERLAACANIIPSIRSIYTWGNRVVDEDEAMIFFKTTDDRVAALTKRIKELHEYEVPEIISVRIQRDEGNPSYLDWVREVVDTTTS
jgi:periplasmic divalent cation tolerance protein